MGPRLLNHVKCQKCGTTYNGKSGKSNAIAIAVYSVIVLIIVIVVLALINQ